VVSQLESRGFYIADKNLENFGLIFGQIDLLEVNQKNILNDELDKFLSKFEYLIKLNVTKLKFTPPRLKKNLILEIIILRKINLLSSIYRHMSYEDYIPYKYEQWFFEIIDALFSVEKFIRGFIYNFKFAESAHLISNSEKFNLTWRFPRDSELINELLCAENINYISSNEGNTMFNSLNDLIRSKALNGAPKIEFSYSSNEYLKLSYGDKILTFNLLESPLIEALEVLGFKVNTSKNKLIISWG